MVIMLGAPPVQVGAAVDAGRWRRLWVGGASRLLAGFGEQGGAVDDQTAPLRAVPARIVTVCE